MEQQLIAIGAEGHQHTQWLPEHGVREPSHVNDRVCHQQVI